MLQHPNPHSILFSRLKCYTDDDLGKHHHLTPLSLVICKNQIDRLLNGNPTYTLLLVEQHDCEWRAAIETDGAVNHTEPFEPIPASPIS